MKPNLKAVAIALLFLSGAFGQTSPTPNAACGPDDITFQVTTDKSRHPVAKPETGKALIYVFGDGSFGIDGQWAGAVRSTYFFTTVEPGEHHLCARFSDRVAASIILVKHKAVSLHLLNAKPGEIYYFDARFNSRDWSFSLEQFDPDEGARRVALSRFGIARPR